VASIYSDKPGQTPPYEFTFGVNQCGTYNAEGNCYNREHTIPETYFNAAEPMRSDLFVVYPVDGWVNNKRSDFAYGVVTTPTWTSQNGSKLGPNTFTGAPSTTAFEPIDSFKGDLARTYFYYATRYFTQDSTWADWDMAKGTELKPWAVQMLLEWHHADTVSQKEINRNDSAYVIQHNRNPFIDYPVFADCIWGGADCSSLDVANVFHDIPIAIFPNPASNEINISFPFGLKENGLVTVMNVAGQVVFNKTNVTDKALKMDVSNWPKGVYFLQIGNGQKTTFRKLLVQ
jgi:endonuclease I